MVLNGLERSLLDAASSAFLFFSFMVLAMLAVRQPARRLVIARAAVLASLAIVPLGGLGLWPRLNVLDLLVVSGAAPSQVFGPGERPGAVPASGPGTDDSTLFVEPSPGNATVSNAAGGLVHGLFWLLAFGEVLGLAWLGLGLASAGNMVRHSEELAPGAREFLAGLVAAGADEARRWNTRVSERARRPMVAGLFRPTILLPRSIAHDGPDMDTGPLRLSVWHEQAHIERHDHWFSALAGLAQTIWFFLPQAWWIRNRLLIDQEFLADQAAARRYGSRSRYAAALVALAAGGPSRAEGRGHPAGPAPNGVPSVLMQRVMMLLRCPFPLETRPPRASMWALRSLVLLGSMVAAGVTVHWPRPALLAASNTPVGPWIIPVGDTPAPMAGKLNPPPRFELEVDVWCRRSDLAALRIAGYSPRDATLFPRTLSGQEHRAPLIGPSAWRHVRLRRDAWKTALEVDGEPLELAAGPQPATNWLTIAPSATPPAEFRNLSITW